MGIEDLKKAFGNAKIKKVSFNINEKTLEMVDGLKKIYGTDRTNTIGAIIMSGIKAQTNFTEKLWKVWVNDKKYVDKKKLITKKLKEIKEFKKKWKVDTIPS